MGRGPVRRSCTACGKVFNGTSLRCDSCRRRRERTCGSCGETFTGGMSRCNECRESDRTCGRCGEVFRGTGLVCGTCLARTERTCKDCGRTFKGRHLRCPPCRRVKRICAGCGDEFMGSYRKCERCRATERTCEDCGETFTGLALKCASCVMRSWWKSLPPEVRQAKRASRNNARRAREAAQTDVCGPVPQKVYEAIRGSGPCVYCGGAATTVDHVRPLVHGGWEHESNLVPACGPCNFSKGPRLLTKWHLSERVIYGIEHSPKVAAEYERLIEEAA
jgi:HNH endonuclease